MEKKKKGEKLWKAQKSIAGVTFSASGVQTSEKGQRAKGETRKIKKIQDGNLQWI